MTDEAYAQLKRLIVRCELAPSMQVTEGQLADKIGIGKTPVREALARLAQEDLVRAIPRHGYEVAPITLQDVHDQFGLRLMIEPPAYEIATDNLTEARARELRRLCDELTSADGPDAIERNLDATREFHLTVVAWAGNRRLLDVFTRLEDDCRRLFYLAMLFKPDRAGHRHDHQEVVEAMIARDRARVHALAVDSVNATRQLVIEALVSSPSVLAAQVVMPVERLNPVAAS